MRLFGRGGRPSTGSTAGWTSRLSAREVLAGYDRVSRLYPFVPPLTMWRAWECAAYARQALKEPVLDVGCGDGRFFRLVWPTIRRAVGVEMDPATSRHARASGVYERVLEVPASRLPETETGYGSAFANCSLEHMDDLDAVLRGVHRALIPHGRFLCSVMTDRAVAWLTLPPVIEAIAGAERAEDARAAYLRYHHLVNPLTPAAWCERFLAAGFRVRERIPILPEVTGRFFLAIDQLWHVGAERGSDELGGGITAFLGRHRRFPAAFRHVLQGLIETEEDGETACGAVFLVEKPADPALV